MRLWRECYRLRDARIAAPGTMQGGQKGRGVNRTAYEPLMAFLEDRQMFVYITPDPHTSATSDSWLEPQRCS